MRYRITSIRPGEQEQTWVMLPDRESAETQAIELAQDEKSTIVTVYEETVHGDGKPIFRRNEPASP